MRACVCVCVCVHACVCVCVCVSHLAAYWQASEVHGAHEAWLADSCSDDYACYEQKSRLRSSSVCCRLQQCEGYAETEVQCWASWACKTHKHHTCNTFFFFDPSIRGLCQEGIGCIIVKSCVCVHAYLWLINTETYPGLCTARQVMVAGQRWHWTGWLIVDATSQGRTWRGHVLCLVLQMCGLFWPIAYYAPIWWLLGGTMATQYTVLFLHGPQRMLCGAMLAMSWSTYSSGVQNNVSRTNVDYIG